MMKPRRSQSRILCSAFISLLLTLSLCSSLSTPYQTAPASLQQAGFGDTLEEFANTIDEFSETIEKTKELLSRVAAILEAITKIAGIRSIIFIIFVLLLSAGIAPSGLLEGKSVFFFSLVLLDLCWFFLLGVYYSAKLILIKDILYANLIAITPFMIIVAARLLLPTLRHLIHFIAARETPYKKVVRTFDEFSTLSAQLIKALSIELKKNSNSESLKLRPQTKSFIKEMIALLQKMLDDDSKQA